MAAWQRLSAGAACAGQGAPCPQLLRLSTSRSVGLYNLCCGMCRSSGLRGSRVLPRRRHRNPRLSQQLRSSLHSSLPPSLLTGSASMSRTSDKPSAQNRTRSHGGGESQTNQQQNQSSSAVPGWRCCAASPVGGCGAQNRGRPSRRSVPARPGAPGPRWSQP